MLIRSQIASEMSGSIGGLTASHNKGGIYFRRRTTPTNPNSPAQNDVRSAVADLVDLWINTLTAVQRAAWDNYAANTLLTDPFGASRHVTGLNMYIRGNVGRTQSGDPRVDDAPVVFNLGSFTTLTGPASTEAAQTVAFTFDNTDAWANEDDASMLVYVSRPRNQTVNYFRGPYRFADSIAGDSVTPPTSPSAIAVPFPVVEDQRVFWRCVVTRADGRLSNEQFMLADVAA